MRLSAGGIRELHWHQQAEWAIVTYGDCRITILDAHGRAAVRDVKEGDLWYFSAGSAALPARAGPRRRGIHFGLRQRASSEFNTLLPTEWLAHTPPTSWLRILACRWTRSATFRCTTNGSSRARCRARAR